MEDFAAQSCPDFEVEDLTILTAWAEGIAEALAFAPECTYNVLRAACVDTSWRVDLRLESPSPRLCLALHSLGRLLQTLTASGNVPDFESVLKACQETVNVEDQISRLARRVLQSTLEQLRTQRAP